MILDLLILLPYTYYLYTIVRALQQPAAATTDVGEMVTLLTMYAGALVSVVYVYALGLPLIMRMALPLFAVGFASVIALSLHRMPVSRQRLYLLVALVWVHVLWGCGFILTAFYPIQVGYMFGLLGVLLQTIASLRWRLWLPGVRSPEYLLVEGGAVAIEAIYAVGKNLPVPSLLLCASYAAVFLIELWRFFFPCTPAKQNPASPSSHRRKK